MPSAQLACYFGDEQVRALSPTLTLALTLALTLTLSLLYIQDPKFEWKEGQPLLTDLLGPM